MSWKETYLSSKRLRESTIDSKRNDSGHFDKRSPFESDFGRVVFSAAARRLHDKTQVFPLTEDDNIHSRLTHSMEVMNIGLSFAINLAQRDEFLRKTGLSKDDVHSIIDPILKTSCLVHDIGNPPFGHFGEVVFQEYFKSLFGQLKQALNLSNSTSCLAADIVQLKQALNLSNSTSCLAADIVNSLDDDEKKQLREFLEDEEWKADYACFDGNAEGLRVLTKLQYIGDLYGLNLTYGTLAASIKYPNDGAPQKGHIARHKHGIFKTEVHDVEKIATHCNMKTEGGYKRHPLSFLMEAADSICYLVMDIDDAVSKGWIDYNTVRKSIEDSEIDESVKCILECDSSHASVNHSPDIQKWVGLRTRLLSHLVDVAIGNFENNLDRIEDGTYNKELIEDGDGLSTVLSDIFYNSIVIKKEIVSLEITGSAVITGLFDTYLRMLFHTNEKVGKHAKSMISRSIFKTILHEHLMEQGMIDEAYTDITEYYNKFDVKDFSVEERLRLVRDFVACMTDNFALSHYQKISGQKL